MDKILSEVIALFEKITNGDFKHEYYEYSETLRVMPLSLNFRQMKELVQFCEAKKLEFVALTEEGNLVLLFNLYFPFNQEKPAWDDSAEGKELRATAGFLKNWLKTM